MMKRSALDIGCSRMVFVSEFACLSACRSRVWYCNHLANSVIFQRSRFPYVILVVCCIFLIFCLVQSTCDVLSSLDCPHFLQNSRVFHTAKAVNVFPLGPFVMARQAVPAPNADSVLVLPDPVRRNAKYIALAFVCMGILAYTYGGPSERSYDDEACNCRFHLHVFPPGYLGGTSYFCCYFHTICHVSSRLRVFWGEDRAVLPLEFEADIRR
jgi:hypothetical protein